MQHFDPLQIGNRFLQPDEFLTETHLVEPMPEAHWHDHVELNLLMRGGMTYLINGKQVRLRAGALYCFWAAVPHQVTVADELTELVCVYLPFADLLSLVVSSDFKNDLMSGSVLTTHGVDPADILLVTRWARDWQGAGDRLADIMRDEVHCICAAFRWITSVLKPWTAASNRNRGATPVRRPNAASSPGCSA